MNVFRGLTMFLALSASAPAFAQSANYTSVETVAGASTQIGYYGSAKKGCAPAPAPTLRVVKPPKHGVLSVKSGTVTTSRIANCPNLRTPAQVVFYQGNGDYQGADEVAYEVTNFDAEVAVYNISITVKPAPKPAPQSPGQAL